MKDDNSFDIIDDLYNNNLTPIKNSNLQNIKHPIPKIRVVVRKRPANQKELQQNDIDIIESKNNNTIVVKELK